MLWRLMHYASEFQKAPLNELSDKKEGKSNISTVLNLLTFSVRHLNAIKSTAGWSFFLGI
jgi:hypothetical protein